MGKLGKVLKTLLIINVLLLILSLPIAALQEKLNPTKYMDYTEFLEKVEEGEVNKVIYSATSEKMEVYLFDAETRSLTWEERVKSKTYSLNDEVKYISFYPNTETFREDLLLKDVVIELGAVGSSPMSRTLWASLWRIVLIYFFYLIMQPMLGTTLGKTEAINGKTVNTRFFDVKCHDEIVSELQSIVDLIVNFKDDNKDRLIASENTTMIIEGLSEHYDEMQTRVGKSLKYKIDDTLYKIVLSYYMLAKKIIPHYKKLFNYSTLDDSMLIKLGLKEEEKKELVVNANPPAGILLVGPPGNGKTLIARAIAGESTCKYYQVNASSFIELYVGLGAKRVRNLFADARRHSPAIIFIDEIDAIGGSRRNQQTSSEDTQTLNALLQEMDGFTKNKGITVIAATNHPEVLSRALTRSGRFDRQITVNPPKDYKDRLELLEYYCGKQKMASDVRLLEFSKMTVGFSCADIESLVNQAAINAKIANHDSITNEDIDEALDKIELKGNRLPVDKNDKNYPIICYHEAGHAIMRYLLNEPIVKITVQGTTSGIGGYVRGEENTMMDTKSSVERNIMIAYGGRVSEEIKFGKDNITIGAMNDIDNATEMLKKHINMLGFKEGAALVNWSLVNSSISETVQKSIDEVSKKLMSITKELLTSNYFLVEALVEQLQITPTIYSDDILMIIKDAIDKKQQGE